MISIAQKLNTMEEGAKIKVVCFDEGITGAKVTTTKKQSQVRDLINMVSVVVTTNNVRSLFLFMAYVFTMISNDRSMTGFGARNVHSEILTFLELSRSNNMGTLIVSLQINSSYISIFFSIATKRLFAFLIENVK
jgi:hypothetical protein